MSYMEGIGDEVLVSVAVATIVIVCLLVWSLFELNANQPSPVHTNGQISQVNASADSRTAHQRDDATSDSTERQTELPEREEPEERPSDSPETERMDNEETSVEDRVESTSSVPQDNVNSTDVRQRRLEFFNVKNCVEEVPTANCSQLANGSATLVALATDTEVETQRTDVNVIRIRLKYLDDTQRTVESQPDQLIQDFRRSHFSEELSNNRLVRLISNGYVLEDLRTLHSYGLVDNSVVHVQIQTNQVNSRRPSNNEETELDMGQFLSPILGVALLCVWIMHFQYKEYFSTTATLALLVLSGLFLTVVWGQHGSRTFNTPLQ